MISILKVSSVSAILFGLLGFDSTVNASNIVYSIEDQPSYEAGWQMSGTITTDGHLGTLSGGDILSWSVTLENGPTTLNFTDNGQAVDAFGGFSSFWGLAATATTLYAPIPPTNGGATGLSLGSPFFPGATSGAQGPTVSWYFSDFTPNTSFSGVNPQTGYFWRVTGSSLNSFDWVIGTASANVPEPTGLELAGLGVLGLIVFSIRQRQYTKAAV